MNVFLTGATGYLGSYVAAELLRRPGVRLSTLVRASTVAEAEQRLWRSLQLHFDFEPFVDLLRTRVDVVLGDLTQPALGLEPADWGRLVPCVESIIHCAASLNRRSAKTCFNVNLRGTLEVIKLARDVQLDHGLRRFSDVSTCAVAGRRHGELVTEERAVEWDRSDYDPYARTKKFAEHLVAELLPDVPTTVFRPSTVLGDSRFVETTQFDMVRAFVWLARLPVLPFRSEWRMDIVPADFVGRAIAHIHQSDAPQHGAYHLSSGAASLSYAEVRRALVESGHGVRVRFAPRWQRLAARLVRLAAAAPRHWSIARGGALLDVFWPYLVQDTVFDNRRVVAELGHAPAPFSDYAYGLMQFALSTGFQYPYRPWPSGEASRGPQRHA